MFAVFAKSLEKRGTSLKPCVDLVTACARNDALVFRRKEFDFCFALSRTRRGSRSEHCRGSGLRGRGGRHSPPAVRSRQIHLKPKVLFICVHNSARSQMAEAWLNHLCGDFFEARSAGLEPGTLNPLAVAVMKEAGIDISEKKTQSVFDVFKSGQLFAHVITV